jgi:4-hydroxythreonine-4-phosphate dehydrogenase
MRPIIAITMGDPGGVGPEIIVRAFDSPGFPGECAPLVIGERLPVERAIGILGSSVVVKSVADRMLPSLRSDSAERWDGMIPLLDPAERDESSTKPLTITDIEFGRPSPAACETAVSWIRRAVELARTGAVDAVCTCPVNKEQLHRQGFAFPGHTEFLKELTGAASVVMMLAGPRLKVALATIHEPLAKVPGLITKELLHRVIRITAESMARDFALESPRIAVCGLNPHAGEAGKFGREEKEVIRPVIEEFVGSGSQVTDQAPANSWLQEGLPASTSSPMCTPALISGPWPADTIFYRAHSGEFDVVVAMYHDQGLIPIKLVHFNEAVNVSLGLPIVRTSVDHGTAYDIAGAGMADPGSLIEAVKLADTISRNRSK